MSDTRILVVEDEALVAMEIEERLIKFGYDVVGTIPRGEDAVDGVQSLRPDLVLMDIKLAGEMDGIRAAEYIRRRYDLPVVYLTAHSDKTTLTKALDSVPLGYVVKPFTGIELHTTIETALKKHQSEKQSREMTESFGKAASVMGGAVILTDGHGTVRHMNSLAEVMTGWKKSEALGKPVNDVLILKRRDTDKPAERRYLSGSDGEFVVPATSCTLTDKAGSEAAIDIAVLPMGDCDGLPRYVIFSFHEQTGRKSAGRDWVSATANLLISAELSRSEGDSDQAVSFYERALAVLESHVERDSPRVGMVLEDLAKAYGQAGRDEEARMFRVRSAWIRSRHQADGRPNSTWSSGYRPAGV